MTIDFVGPAAGNSGQRGGRAGSVLFPGVCLLSVLSLATFGMAYETEAVLESELRKALDRKDFHLASGIIEKTVEMGTAAAMDVVCNHAFFADDPEMERYAVDKLAGVPSDGPAIQRLSQIATKHQDYRVRVALSYALQRRSEQAAVTALFQNVYDAHTPVAMAALESIQKRDHLVAVTPLIDALDYLEQQGRKEEPVHQRIRAVLTFLTGEQELQSALEWRNFWSSREQGYQRPAQDKRREGRTAVAKGSASFFGMEVATKKFIFVIDISESMKKRDPLPEEGGTETTRKPGGRTGLGKGEEEEEPEPPKQEDIPASRERLSRVQKELIATIEKLPNDSKFGILTFCHEVEMFRPDLIDASKINKQRAIEFIRNLRPHGETSTDEALKQAFESFRGIDSVFLLSDGAPRRDNKLLDTEEILKYVRDINRFRRVRVYTVCFEQAGSSLQKFMKKLAYENHGSYKGLR